MTKRSLPGLVVPMMRSGTGGRRWAMAALSLAALSLLVFWPGVAEYDSVDQYRQVLSGRYEDWHPPVMAALWRLLHRTVGGGAAPLFALQIAGWWAGIGLIAAALGRNGRERAAMAVIAIGIWPPFLGWQAQVLKDAQMTGALLLATGVVAWWRIDGASRRGRSPSPLARAALAVLLGYAILVRANAVFCVAPLVALLWPGGWRRRAAVGAAVLAAGLALAGPVNHRLLGATPTGVERTEALYDLAGIAVRTPAVSPLPLTAAERQAIVGRHCATPFFWDPLGDACEAAMARLYDRPTRALYGDLVSAAWGQPVAYLRHRLSHLNSTERWLVPIGWLGAEPPPGSEPNRLGLGSPGRVGFWFEAVAGWLAGTPAGWPVAWVVVAWTAVAVALARPAAPARDLALALAGSALGQEASFAVLSIASDLRYHLWPMLASALAAVLLADRRPPRSIAAAGGAALVLVVAAGLTARLLLPPAPPTLAALLDGRSAAAETF